MKKQLLIIALTLGALTAQADQCKDALSLMQIGLSQIETSLQLCPYPGQVSNARASAADGHRNIVDGSGWCHQFCGTSYNCSGYRSQGDSIYSQFLNICR